MSKILKPYTIIPQELYVKRDADRQVQYILNDMGRPGYVLVSRQMGKTNLLLNAKRNLETSEDVFVYIDLSNSFKNAQSCFENIIDIAIETNEEKFGASSRIIEERRRELMDTPPHKQHSNELRILLQALRGGKLVIILDEIDALTKTDYSDQIFSQIRSSYFAGRVNYPEFYNLTYLLSGVVEPNEIIKDSKISPFNIGQKIFLNDFSREEFDQFLIKAKLTLPKEAADRVFFWTNGNPRITWDVCSEIENITKQTDIRIETVDKVINDMYLTTFDRPPIDNIREIVKGDKELRNSIIEIEYKKGKEVSDKIKNKLYLSGIINYEENDIKIKNEIIRESLNLNWIRSLEEEEKGLVRIATELFEKENYQEALSAFERYLLDSEFEERDQPLYYYYMGYAAYRNSDFEKAITYLAKADFDIDEDSKWFFRIYNLKGLAYYYNNQIDESLLCFKVVIDSGRKDEIYARALINFGSISLKSENLAHRDEAEEIFKRIIDETGFNKQKLKEGFIDELKSIAYFNLAQLQVSTDHLLEANKNFDAAISLAKENAKPAMILNLLKITDSPQKAFSLLEQLIELITSGKAKPVEDDPEKPTDFNYEDFRNVVIKAFTDYNTTLFPRLRPHLKELGEQSVAKHLYDLAIFSINKNRDTDSAIKILNSIYYNFEDPDFIVDVETRYKVLKLLAYFTKPKEPFKIYYEFLSLFAKERLELIDYLDMEIFANFIFVLTEKKKYQEGLKYVNLINSTIDTVPENLLINFIVIYHLELNLYLLANERHKAIEKAQQILHLANNEKIKKQNSNLLGETGLEFIKQNAESTLNPKRRVQEPVRVGKVYGRNELIKVRYKDGTTLEVKYKKVEDDIRNGACLILE